MLTDIPEDNTIFGGSHFDARFDAGEIVRSHCNGTGFINDLKITYMVEKIVISLKNDKQQEGQCLFAPAKHYPTTRYPRLVAFFPV